MKRRVVGFVLIFISIFLVLFNARITGAVVGTAMSNSLSFLALVLFIIGLIMTHAKHTQSLESTVTVYDDPKDRSNPHRSEAHYFITDPANGQSASLADFTREVDSYKGKGKEGEDFIEIAREIYERGLLNIVKSGDAEKANIARQFLRVLNPEIEIEEEDSESYRLTKEEREELKSAFKQWKGVNSRIDNNISRKYSLNMQQGNKHVKLWQRSYPENIVVAPASPSDWRGGRNLASMIIHMIEENRKKKKG